MTTKISGSVPAAATDTLINNLAKDIQGLVLGTLGYTKSMLDGIWASDVTAREPFLQLARKHVDAAATALRPDTSGIDLPMHRSNLRRAYTGRGGDLSGGYEVLLTQVEAALGIPHEPLDQGMHPDDC